MRNIVLGQNDRVKAWVAEQINDGSFFGECQTMGVEDENGELIAGVVYDGYSPGSRISMHCAGIGKRWLTKQFLWMCFDFPFNQAGVKVIINPVASTDEESIRFTEHCGFKKMCVIKDGCGYADMIVYALHRDECKWLGVKHG